MFLAYTPAWDPHGALFRALNLAGSNPLLDAAMVALTIAGTAYVLALLAIPLYARRRKEVAFDILAAIALTLVATEAVRYLFGVPRPCQVLSDVRTVPFIGCPEDPAFPSGHASRAFGVAVVLAFRFPSRIGVSAFALAALIALSRVYLGVHWPADILAGSVLGAALGVGIEGLARRSPAYRRGRAATIRAVDRVLARLRRR